MFTMRMATGGNITRMERGDKKIKAWTQFIH